MNPAPATTSTSTSATKVRLAPSTLVIGATLLGFVVGFTILLWPEWQQNPDLSHGFFAPLIFALLVWESRKNGTPRWLPENAAIGALATFSLVTGVALFGMAGLLAASVAWTHSLVSFVLGASLCAFLFGGLVILSGERVRAVPFNWISLTAILLWLLVSPLPQGTYARLTLGLQSWVTSSVLHTLHLLGIPARQHGNVIELALTTVGVEEACSGIRSLLSCIYAGFFFAAWQVRRPLARAVLIIAAPLLALGMNFLRSLLLTLLANAGKEIEGFWHDTTGFAILGITALMLAGLAILLESKSTKPAAPQISKACAPRRALSTAFFATVTVTLALGIFYLVKSRAPDRAGAPIPNIAALLPAEPAGWSVTVPKDLYQFTDILQTDTLFERTYLHTNGDGQFTQFTVYVAYWAPGQASVSRVASHTPDACWPGAGWISRPVEKTNEALELPGIKIPAGEHRLFETVQGYPQNVWFWHVHDGRVINYQDPYSVPALLQIALKYGFRRQGEQLFIRVSSNKPWSEISREPLVREIFANLAPLGLKTL
ncbi:exosortase/archaeosortase family protein [Oleiharenicola lentus]|uniref:exosortase/archaeosortase family protein n=1 Tax=Oleiharenicola lentus TaxID=2508720 RepID=UPI003F668CED